MRIIVWFNFNSIYTTKLIFSLGDLAFNLIQGRLMCYILYWWSQWFEKLFQGSHCSYILYLWSNAIWRGGWRSLGDSKPFPLFTSTGNKNTPVNHYRIHCYQMSQVYWGGGGEVKTTCTVNLICHGNFLVKD